jgi:hypothetical protein
VAAARGDVLAFSDANALWEPARCARSSPRLADAASATSAAGALHVDGAERTRRASTGATRWPSAALESRSPR